MHTVAHDPSKVSGSPPTVVTRIAVGVDGFPEGHDATALGRALADVTGADLMLVMVHSDPLILPPIGVEWSKLRREARALLHKARAAHAPHAHTTIETDFSVPRALHRVISEGRHDLLVMGSSRQGPEGRVRIGKRTRQLLCSFEYPLAIAPRGYSSRPSRRFSQIGVGYDGGPEAQAALELASWIALGAKTELELYAVVDDRTPPIGWSRFASGGAAHAEWEDAVSAEIERLGAEAENALSATGANGHVKIRRGRPADALVELSEFVDLVVIGSRRWGPVKRVLLGTTGESLVHDAACPVVLVPRPHTE
jgi:nucleotide-binding universal stress UspA family protein